VFIIASPSALLVIATITSLSTGASETTGASVTAGDSDEQPAANNIKPITPKEMIRLIKQTLTTDCPSV
jgi:hypothetical protein